MDVKNFVMVYNEIGEQGGVKMHEHEAEHGYFIIRNLVFNFLSGLQMM